MVMQFVLNSEDDIQKIEGHFSPLDAKVLKFFIPCIFQTNVFNLL
jgi:hypothetical protein